MSNMKKNIKYRVVECVLESGEKKFIVQEKGVMWNEVNIIGKILYPFTLLFWFDQEYEYDNIEDAERLAKQWQYQYERRNDCRVKSKIIHHLKD